MSIMAYLLGALFLGWLALVVARTRRLVRAGKAGVCGGAGGQFLAVLVQDRADYVEGLVRRLAAGRESRPGLRPVLVDGGSADETALIVARLARRFNLGFCRLGDLGPGCARAGAGCCGGHYPVCQAECLGPGEAGGPVRCLDLRQVPGPRLVKYDLFRDCYTAAAEH